VPAGHSWFGNLVTNANWGDFFLNEGFTMYAQRRLTTEVFGLPYTHLEAIAGWNLLKAEVEEQGADSALTR
jgi:aminopeptidase B